MVKKTKEEKQDNFYEMCRNLSNNMSMKVEELSKQRDDMFLTLVWFLIATSGIIITSSCVTCLVKWCLWLSIICFALWFFCNLKLIWLQSNKVHVLLKEVFPIPKLKTKKEKLEAIEKIEKWIQPNDVDIFLDKLKSFLQWLWIILFIVWLFIYL